MTGGESKKPAASIAEIQQLAVNRVADHLAEVIRQGPTSDHPASNTAAPEKRISVHVDLEENFHRALKKVLVTYGNTWQTTIQGLLRIWLVTNLENGVLSRRDVEGIPKDMILRLDEPES